MLCEHLLLFQHLIFYLLQVNLCLLSGQVFGPAAVLAAAFCAALRAVVGQADPYNIDYFTSTLTALRWPLVRLQGSCEFSVPPLLSISENGEYTIRDI